MSITNRLSLFFLGALALVLVGFSSTMYLLAQWHLNAQLDRHIESALSVLIAAIEVYPEDVQWEPLERKVTIGNDPDLTQVRWAVHDDQSQLVDCSTNMTHQCASEISRARPDWHISIAHVRAGQFVADHSKSSTIFAISQDEINALMADRTTTSTSFLLTVALSEEPVRAALANLAIAMSAVSVSIWALAAFWGRWLCKRALRPVTEMAERVRTIQQTPDSNFVLDVSPNHDELTDLGSAFNQLLATLRESIDRQQRFAGDASHQLRTPLTAILAAVDFAVRHDRSPEEYQRVLAVVQRRGRDLQQIIEILMALTRRDPRDESLKSELLDLNAWCAEHLELWHGHVRRIDVHLATCPRALFVKLQPTLLGQVIDNLLDNACKYSDPDTPITIRTQIRDGNAVISVEDHGPGIPLSDLEQIFDPFFRSEKARISCQSGCGLGLTLAQRLVTALGGTLEVESESGRGSSFRIVIPCETVEVQDISGKEISTRSVEALRPAAPL